MTYNPQEWAGGRQSVEGRQRRDCYGEPLVTPPPAYPGSQALRDSGSSGNSRQAPTFASGSTSPMPQDEPSTYTRPKPLSINTRQMADPRRATMGNTGGRDYNPSQSYQQYRPQHHSYHPSSTLSMQQNRRTSDSTSIPPPPPLTHRMTPPLTTQETDANGRLSYGALRSTSAGPTPTAGPSVPRTTRAMSNAEQSNGLTTLPGPPSIRPLNSSRSRSAGGQDGLTVDFGGSRQRPARLQLKNSNLTPIPATPASVNSNASSRQMRFPLRIDTGIGQGKAPAIVEEVQPDLPLAQAGPSSLARRSAVRGPAARSSGQLIRSRSKSITGRSDAGEQIEPPSTTMSLNPWHSALQSARSPQEESLPESSVLPRMDMPPRKSHTPPATPSSLAARLAADERYPAQQAKVLPTPPLSHKPLLSANSLSNSQLLNNAFGQEEDFVAEAMERHAAFLKQEQEAGTDLEKLNLFMQFMQQESLIRKERYIAAYQSNDFKLDAAKSLLFNSSKVRRASARDEDGSMPSSPLPKPDGWWKEDYRPNLSPIASMEYDEMSSRGRAPSRWWESATGSQSDDKDRHSIRSKRESKYMSLSKKLLQDMETAEMDPLYEDAPWLQNDQYPNEKANPETFGYYDDGIASPPSTQQSQVKALRTSGLDISRFITLPPPYPRHYPAVNNSHPDLAEYRTTVRMLSDLKDAKNCQQRHQVSIRAMREERQNKIKDIKRAFRNNIQSQIDDGTLSYTEAAEVERSVRSEEHTLQREGLQAEFDTLQDVVVNPLHEQLNERIIHLNNSLEALQKELIDSAAHQDPDQPVQEGDDVPELLEQLTQLKWLFEAREILHQEVFDLLSQRNEAYKAIVALPYHQTNNIDKIRDTEAFFEKDAATRHATACADALKRHEEFLSFIEDNALRGIEQQASTFWDIHPGLLEMLQKIPSDLNQLEIHIPDSELLENPSYQTHPQQYLYSLLRHAEQSTRQFIEGQVNLYCLVHEVKTGLLTAHYTASKAQQKMAGDQSIDLQDTRLEDESELTAELKNRAAMIEEQWDDALGKHFKAVIGRVKGQLIDKGAWEDVADEGE